MKFKKMLAVVSALCMMCAVVPVLPEFVPETAVISASAEGEEEPESIYENLKYRKYADYVEISGVTGKEITEANIPAEIDGLPVTSIGNYAFSYFPELTSVTIPDSVTNIGEGAFFLSGLTSVTIPDSVTSIGDYAFRCEMTSIVVSENNPAYTSENGVLFNKEKTILIAYPAGNTRTEYMIPSGVTSIERLAFFSCSGLTSVTIPDSVTSIGIQAFSGCSGLTSVTIPDSATSIGWGAFEECSSLTSVTIPESVTSIETRTFSETPWLKAKQEENPLVIVNHILIDGATCEGDVIIPESVTSIGGGAFSHSELTSVTIPESVTSISDSTFWHCHELTAVTIPDSVTSIGESAFYSCSGLTSVIIPESVTSIGSSAFGYCSGLTSVTIENPDCEIYDSEDTISNLDNYSGTIYGYENSTAQAYAEKYGYTFEVLGSAPETSEPTEAETSAPAAPAEDMVWNGVNPDINRDGTIDAADSAVLLTYAAEFGAGKVSSFKEFMDKYYS